MQVSKIKIRDVKYAVDLPEGRTNDGSKLYDAGIVIARVKSITTHRTGNDPKSYKSTVTVEVMKEDKVNFVVSDLHPDAVLGPWKEIEEARKIKEAENAKLKASADALELLQWKAAIMMQAAGFHEKHHHVRSRMYANAGASVTYPRLRLDVDLALFIDIMSNAGIIVPTADDVEAFKKKLLEDAAS